MKPIEPEELSAYLDDELSQERRREIDQALASDSTLKAELESLTRVDAMLRDAGAQARFLPSVQLPSASSSSTKPGTAGLAAVVAVLALVRLVPKWLEPELVDIAIVNGIVLGVLLAGTAWMIQRQGDGVTTVVSRES